MSSPTRSQTLQLTTVCSSKRLLTDVSCIGPNELQRAYLNNNLLYVSAGAGDVWRREKNRIKLRDDLGWPRQWGRSQRRWYGCSVDSWQTSPTGGAICHYVGSQVSVVAVPCIWQWTVPPPPVIRFSLPFDRAYSAASTSLGGFTKRLYLSVCLSSVCHNPNNSLRATLKVMRIPRDVMWALFGL